MIKKAFNAVRNVLGPDNLYRVGRNVFMPRVTQREHNQMLEQLRLTDSINKRQAPLRAKQVQQRMSNAFQPTLEATSQTPPQTPSYTSKGPADLAPLIVSIAKKHGINPRFLDALVFAESSYNPQAVSKSGAYGLTQLMPTTLAELGYKQPPNTLTPQQQLDYGAQYLKKIYAIRQRKLGVNRPLTPLEWYHAYSFGPNTTRPISPQYQANWERAYNR